jgi:dsRNA-specific ribonuclease
MNPDMTVFMSYCERVIKKSLNYQHPEFIKLFKRSTTHESYDSMNSYERLEFLGDSIIGFLVAKYLYIRFDKQNESFLTEMKIKIVNSNMLSWLCKCMKLNIHIKIKDNINPNKIYEDVFEAFMGAFYLFFGIYDTEKLILGILENPNFIDFTDLILNDYNYKKKLMILLQKKLDGRLPVFHNLPMTDSLFHTVVCHPNGRILGIGISKTIKLAQQSACKMALENEYLHNCPSESEYQQYLERKRFEKPVDYQINENNLMISPKDVKNIWRKYSVEVDQIYHFENYQNAFIHKSYFLTNDPRYSIFTSNERLNFLGNSLLMYLITDFLFEKYPTENEGYLTKIKTSEIQNRNLFSYCILLDLNKYLVLTKNDEINRYSQSHSEQLFCSVLGAMFLDQGVTKVKEWIFDMWTQESKMVNILDENYKHQLLLKIQENPQYKFYKYPFPTYHIIASETNYEKKVFAIQVMDPNGTVIGKGTGKTKKEAEQDSSKNALALLASSVSLLNGQSQSQSQITLECQMFEATESKTVYTLSNDDYYNCSPHHYCGSDDSDKYENSNSHSEELEPQD